MKQVKTAEEIVDEIMEAITFHQNCIAELQEMLPNRNGRHRSADIIIPSKLNSTESFSNIQVSSIEPSSPINNRSFIDTVVDILTRNEAPLLTRTLMELYFKATGKRYERKDFSSRLSIESKGKKRVVPIIKKEFPNDSRYWWAVNTWIVDNKLNPEYDRKIHVEMSKINNLK